jgi:hypothetical protein
MSAHTFAFFDKDKERGIEEWYEYQFRISKVDKSKILSSDPNNDGLPNCRHCGHSKTMGDGVAIFRGDFPH